MKSLLTCLAVGALFAGSALYCHSCSAAAYEDATRSAELEGALGVRQVSPGNWEPTSAVCERYADTWYQEALTAGAPFPDQIWMAALDDCTAQSDIDSFFDHLARCEGPTCLTVDEE